MCPLGTQDTWGTLICDPLSGLWTPRPDLTDNRWRGGSKRAFRSAAGISIAGGGSLRPDVVRAGWHVSHVMSMNAAQKRNNPLDGKAPP